MTRLLGIEVSQADVQRMAARAVPVEQPFWGAPELLAATGVRPRTRLARTLCDTFGRWDGEPHVLLDESAFLDLPRPVRSRLVRAQVGERGLVPAVRAWPGLRDRVCEQADGHRFVWWPSLVDGIEAEVVRSVVEPQERPSRHAEVPDAVWAACDPLLPGARALAGSFSPTGEGNCFSTVLAATGLDVADEWVVREPFEDFLATGTVRGGRDEDPGTILVWRSADGLVQHACVTLGGGWALNKPSQEWQTPRAVLTVEHAKLRSRAPGLRLTRRRVVR